MIAFFPTGALGMLGCGSSLDRCDLGGNGESILAGRTLDLLAEKFGSDIERGGAVGAGNLHKKRRQDLLPVKLLSEERLTRIDSYMDFF